MSSPSTNAEVTAADQAGRWPLLLLLASGLVWLVVSGILALVASIQLHTPAFMADCEWFTHGRLTAIAETSFVYGWAANAGLGIALWVLGRLGGSPLRALNWAVVGTLFWNTGIALGIAGIASGDATSFSLLEMPRYVQPLLAAAYVAIGLSGILAWNGRRTDGTFASQWYAVAALFLFPWLLIAAQSMLLWTPVRGVLQAVVVGWYVQGAFSLWLAPLALAGAYYVVPKATGRALPSYEFAPLAFWTLLFVGSLTGGRHLIGGPVPAWIPTLANAACCMLLFHYTVVALNLRGAFTGGGTALRFISFGLAAYLLGAVLDAVTSFRGVALVTQFTYLSTAQQQLAIYGGISMLLFGSIYFAVPRLTGQAWSSGALLKGHVVLSMLGVLLLVGSLAAAGWTQGHELNDAKVSFADIGAHTRPWLLAVSVAQLTLLLGNILLLVNFAQSVCAACCASSTGAQSPFRQPAAMEAHAS
ncbi:MAG: cbb3-type cytochrome c oxidase subunit I [Verrucomicrobia bacterium]|nr:cbb3-type cytochrome c oxidase subunit I [Verrucomicrobiota bacterium]